MNIDLSLDYIKNIAPNTNAISNGKELYTNGLLRNFHKNAEGDLYFAECIGSGKNPYLTSMDCLTETPVYRCSCPSRQFPCKHNIGLLFAMLAEVEWTIADVPETLAQKRHRAEQRAETKKAVKKTSKPSEKTASKSKDALRKKLQTQLEALTHGQTLVIDIVRTGFKQLEPSVVQQYSQQLELLSAAYLTGIHTDFQAFFLAIRAENYPVATEMITRLHHLIEKAQEYLTQRLQDPELRPSLNTEIEEQLGYAWKLDELIEYGKVQKDAVLVEFAFYSREDTAQAATIDEGFCLEISSGLVYKTQNIRPIKAKKHIKAADSTMVPIEIPELVIYPGHLNPRVRWNDGKLATLETEHRLAFQQHARKEFTSLLKEIKNEIKNPLGQKNPVVIVHAASIQQQDTNIVLVDEQGEKITLGHIPYFPKLFSSEKEDWHDSLWLFHHLEPEYLSNISVALMFSADLGRNQLVAKPLALITPHQLIRLVF